ncbi:bifunctional 2-polyprenyl-6-hydroxyphenol methylase/3-demethylubiquinol 3-O-methyltransferase UbiG [Flavobacterium antarcticum]|uniref:class I SAM-dependent methyltransferase n=1 Tax=Flavobacterium antarcticum TaxID=271155 RepID=UPI0003B39E2B|nr:class I SAM-dependent methyltransferase [Flavobacterium antarcticum]
MIDNAKKIYLTVKDYTVSKETFGLYRDGKYDMLITFPKPSLEELSKYYESEDYISHSNKKKGLFSFLYQIVRGFTLKNKLNIIQHFHVEKGTLLDIGAGTGHFLELAQKNKWIVTGIEPNLGARNMASEKGISFVDNIQSLANNSFDVITMWHVLEHVYDLDEQIKELKRVLKPDGVLVIAVPNFRSFDARYYKRFWAAYDVPRHLWHFSKKSIKLLFQEKQMKVVEMIPMKWDAFYVSLLSEKYKKGYMNFFKAIYVGLKSNYKAKKRFQYSSLIYIIKNDKKSK